MLQRVTGQAENPAGARARKSRPWWCLKLQGGTRCKLIPQVSENEGGEFGQTPEHQVGDPVALEQ